MAIPPLLNLPDSSCIASVVLTLTRVVGRAASPFTLSEQVYKWPGASWSMDFQLPPFTSRAMFADWVSFAAKLGGSWGTFLMGDPSAKIPRGVIQGSPQVNGANQTGNVISTKNWTPSITGQLLKGDYVQFGTGSNSSLHMVVENLNSDGSGNMDLIIEPPLRTAPVDSSVVTVTNAKGVFRLESNEFSWSVSPGPIYRIQFSAREVIFA